MSSIPDKPPLIESLEELLTREQLAQMFDVSEKTIDQWRYGRGSIAEPLPYMRFAGRLYFWRGAILWWLNKQTERPDFYYIDRMRRLKEGKKVGRPRSK